MDSYKDISGKYLKKNLKRTLLTIFGIILSVSLITAISTIIGSAREGMKKEVRERVGTFHGLYEGLEKEDIDKLAKDKRVKKIGLERELGSIALSETTERERMFFGGYTPYKYLELKEVDKNTLDLRSVKLKEGRLPEKPGEIVIDEDALLELGDQVKIGDKLDLRMGERVEKESDDPDLVVEDFVEKERVTYTLVGTTEAKYRWSGRIEFPAITYIDEIKENESYSGLIELDNIKNAYDQLESIGKDYGLGEAKANEELLRLYVEGISETFNTSLILMLALIMGIIIVSAIAVIYNSFNISVIERLEQFGLLRSIGASPSQIRRLIFREAGILSLFGIPLGHLAGILAMKIVFYLIAKMKVGAEIAKIIEIKVFPSVIIFSSILGIITVFLSALGPARKAGKISALEAIRGNTIIKDDKIKRKRGLGIVRAIFGIEGEIAYKNLARNKKRFIITVFSMSLSIMLFITFSSFSQMGFTSLGKHEVDMGDFVLSGPIENSDQIIEEIKALDGIDKVYNFKQFAGSIDYREEKVNPKYLKEESNESMVISEDKRLENINLISIGNKGLEDLKANLKLGDIDLDKMIKGNGVLLVNSTGFYTGKENKFFKDAYKYEPGDKINFLGYSMEDEGESPVDLEVIGVLDEGILDHKYNTHGAINLYVSDELMEKLNEDYGQNTYLYIGLKNGADKEVPRKYFSELLKKNPYYHLIDYAEDAQNGRQFLIIMSIFLYGFVTVISLISAINIINTISTNIILRTKEIGMVKAIGMSQKSVRKMISLESIYYGIYATVFGGAFGLLFTKLFHNLFTGITSFNYTLPVKNLIVASLGAIIISILAGKYPLKKINDKLIVESIKEDN